MFSTIFLPTFYKFAAATIGIGAGTLAVTIVTVLLLVASTPLTNRIK